MTRRLLIFCAFLFGACDASESGQRTAGTDGHPFSSQPNIILVMADDQGWGDMAYNGHPVLRTPHFDALAAEALRFDRFYASSPVCSPTRGSVMTGRHPNRFECFTWGKTLRPEEMTIAEVLQDAGYVTGHFGKWHLGSVRLGSTVNPGASGFDEWLSAPNFFDNEPILSREGIAEKMEGESSMVTVDAALEFIRKHERGEKPYFAVVWFGSPHGPHEAYQEDRNVYTSVKEEKQRHFYGEITGMDRAFGKLRNEVRQLANSEHTIIWYCSDNGGLRNLGATGGRGHKGTVYEGGLRVPALLEWPARITKGRSTNFPSNTSDIFPTILDMIGLEMNMDRPLDGISLMAAIDGNMTDRPDPMGFWNFPCRGVPTPSKEWMLELYEAQQGGNMVGDSLRLRPEAGELFHFYPTDSLPGHAAWLDYPWKLHRIEDGESTVRYELYDLENDSLENRDVLEEQVDRADLMKAQLLAWQQSVVNSMNGKDY